MVKDGDVDEDTLKAHVKENLGALAIELTDEEFEALR